MRSSRTLRLLIAGAVAVLVVWLLRNPLDEDGDGSDSGRGSNVVLISIDTLRAANLGCYGYARDTSPHIDEIAGEGALFLNAFAPSPWTIPSLASLLTGMYPDQHNSREPKSALHEDAPLLTEILKRHGYETAAFVSAAYPLLQMGFQRSFDVHEAAAGPKTKGRIKEWIRARRDRRFFLWIHYFKPHVPYVPSPRHDGLFIDQSIREHRELAEFWNPVECIEHYRNDPGERGRIRMGFYDESIRDSDHHVGEVVGELEELGLTSRTLLIVTSDHGEEFFEHGGCHHGLTLYDEVIRIPLILKHPRLISKGSVVDAQVRIIDIAPTILDLLELERPEEFAGESLLDHSRGRRGDLPVFSGFLTTGEPGVSLRRDGFKYIHSPRRSALVHSPEDWFEDFYDLETDPAERNNLAETGHPRLEEFREEMRSWIDRTEAKLPAKTMPLDAETRARLETLGYLIDP